MKTLKRISVLCLLALGVATMPALASITVNAGDFATLRNAIANYESATDDMVINLTADFNITQLLTIPTPLTADRTLTIRSVNPAVPVTITRSVSTIFISLFTVNTNATLILENIIINGYNSNFNSQSSLIQVNSGGVLVMNGGEISGNTADYGGGVSVEGIFTINGGKISGNTVSTNRLSGGGVFVDGGTFIMNGGAISGNTVGNNNSMGEGGGVSVVRNGTFIMNDGRISENIVSGRIGSGNGEGGGVFVRQGTFTMNGGEISGNTSILHGGGVSVIGSFTMNGGKISENAASADFGNGGGVYVSTWVAPERGVFTMSGGEISRNTARNGGGVAVMGTFTMNNGKISGNTASNNGNGVHVFSGIGITFTMTSGVVSGTAANINNVVNGTYNFNTGDSPAANNGVIIAWNKPATGDTFVYSAGTSDRLLFRPAEAIVFWDAQGGRYGISYRNGNNRGFIEVDGVTVTGSTAITETFDGQSIHVFPNPTDGQLQIIGYELQVENTAYSIFNAMGQLMLQGNIQGVINVESLASGVYYLQIGGQTLRFVRK